MINAENMVKAIKYMEEVADSDMEKWAMDEHWALRETVPVLAEYAFHYGLDPAAVGIGIRIGYLTQRFALDAATEGEEGEVVVPLPVLDEELQDFEHHPTIMDEDIPTAEDEAWYREQRRRAEEQTEGV